MGCCGDSSEVQPIRVNGRALSAPSKGQEFDGPTKNRNCTDILCLIFFLAFCIGGCIYLVVAYVKGDPDRLIHGYDKCGNVCGKNNSKIPNLTCSGVDKTGVPYHDISDLSKTSISNSAEIRGDCKTSCNKNTTILIGFWCFPKDASWKNNSAGIWKEIERYSNIFVQNVQASWREILATCFIGLALSILAILLLRFFAGIIVWFTVGVIIIGSIGGTIALWVIWSEEKKAKDKDQNQVNGFLAAAIIATIFTVITLILLIAMRNRIRLVIQLFKEASKAIAAIPLLLIQPLWTLLFMVLVVGVWAGSWIPIKSSGTFERVSDTEAKLKMDNVIFWMQFYHVFGFLWVTQFVIGCHLMTIAGAVGKWYFTRDKNKIGVPIITSVGNVIRYHLGSIAFGSLIIAIVKAIRLILKFIEKKLGGTSDTLKCLLRCCQCCLWCFENFLKFLNRNAYIEIALFGYSFCKAAKKAFTVLGNNALRLAALNFVGEFVLFLIKLAVVILTGVCGYFIIKSNKNIDSVVPGMIVAMAITILIVYCFVSVYDMTIDTLFICFCEDCEQNDGIDKPYFMSRGLMGFVENSGKAIAALDQRERDAKNNNNNEWKRGSVNTIQIPPNYQQPNTPGPYDSKVNHGKSGMTPLHPAYPPVSAPPSPSNFMPRPE